MTSNPLSYDFSYRKYSLEQLDNWVNDAVNCEDLTPQDIYDTIAKCVGESVDYHKKYYTKSVELLSLLKGHREVDFDASANEFDNYEYDAAGAKFPEAEGKDWHDFWESYTDDEKEKRREYNLREAEYYNKRAQLDADYEAIKAAGGYEWTPEPHKDRVIKWQLPVQQSSFDGVDDYYIEFPDDLLEAANLKEGDTVEWIDRKDGSFELRKV